MWDRVEFKMRGKQMFLKNYWCCVGVAFLMMLLVAIGSTGGARSTDYNVSSQYHYYNEDRYEDYDDEAYYYGDDDYYYGDHYYDGDGIFAGIGRSIAGVMFSVIMLVIAVVILLLTILVGNILWVGGCRFFCLNRSGTPRIGIILEGFKSGHYGNLVLTMFLRDLFTWLWTLLFIIPGIVKRYEYLMIPYVLAENPGMDRKSAFEISKRMMTGHKMDAFILDLSFIGWHLLSALTCGILSIFYVSPYVQATYAEMYSFNRETAYREGFIR